MGLSKRTGPRDGDIDSDGKGGSARVAATRQVCASPNLMTQVSPSPLPLTVLGPEGEYTKGGNTVSAH